ncbi:MAG: acyltransferase, partial [Halobacteriaceae archaeon]
MTKTHVSVSQIAETDYNEFIDEVDTHIETTENLSETVRDILVELNGDRELYEKWQNGEEISSAAKARLRNYNPKNATLESEYYAEKDEESFERSKPLQYLWRQFDNTPLADNIEFALQFRQMLANHLFDDAGDNLRIFKGVTMTYGHNISVGDNTVIHDDVHLDDRGRLDIGNRVSISDGAMLYSHDHDVVDQTEVKNYRTIVEDNVRITQGALVRAGTRIGENALIGARSIVDKDVPAHHIAVGSPVKSVKIKSGWESEATPVDEANERRKESRRIEYDIEDDTNIFDEFKRDLS